MSRATPKTAPAPPAESLRDLFAGVEIGEHEKAEARLRSLYGQLSKEDQRRIAQGLFDLLIGAPANGHDVHVVGSFLEATARLDPALAPMEWVERLTESPVVAHRTSAAIILWELAETMPGIVPIDLVAKLAKASTEDWYVYAPAIAAAKQLALTRRSALGIIVDLARSLNADDRDAAVRALSDLARVDALIVPVEPVEHLAKDVDPSVSDAAKLLLSTLSGITEDDRRYRYGKFGL